MERRKEMAVCKACHGTWLVSRHWSHVQTILQFAVLKEAVEPKEKK
jgi:hypothetical protein